MKKFLVGIFMMLGFLALAMAGGESTGKAHQIWHCIGCVSAFALCMHIVKYLSIKKYTKPQNSTKNIKNSTTL
ncbi:MAG: hypothetical protein GY710_09390 [Desulfobacteraceae bacterium]|nr:hypothetical protein [Desulfobacteraceae bacterium]